MEGFVFISGIDATMAQGFFLKVLRPFGISNKSDLRWMVTEFDVPFLRARVRDIQAACESVFLTLKLGSWSPPCRNVISRPGRCGRKAGSRLRGEIILWGRMNGTGPWTRTWTLF